MTKQEKIREVIDTYTDDGCLYPDKDCVLRQDRYCLSDEDAYKCLMRCLGELGVVIKVDRPIIRKTGIQDLVVPIEIKIMNELEKAYKKAGYVAVEPLIKERKE